MQQEKHVKVIRKRSGRQKEDQEWGPLRNQGQKGAVSCVKGPPEVS